MKISDVPCLDCTHFENCGRDGQVRRYKNGDRYCHAHEVSRFDPDIEIKKEMRERNLRSHIEYLIENRIDRKLW